MKAVTALSVGLVAILTACGQPLPAMSTAPAPMANAQSTKVVKSTAKVVLTASFAALDKNSDKVLDRSEFVMMTGLPFEMVDLNKDGKVTVDEFVSDPAIANFGKSLRSLASGVARALDTDKDRQISETEFMTAFAKADPMSTGLAKTSFEAADHRHYGRLGASEFEDLFVTLVANGALAGMPQPLYPAPKPVAPKPPAPVPAPGGTTPAPAPGSAGSDAPLGPGTANPDPTLGQ